MVPSAIATRVKFYQYTSSPTTSCHRQHCAIEVIQTGRNQQSLSTWSNKLWHSSVVIPPLKPMQRFLFANLPSSEHSHLLSNQSVSAGRNQTTQPCFGSWQLKRSSSVTLRVDYSPPLSTRSQANGLPPFKTSSIRRPAID